MGGEGVGGGGRDGEGGGREVGEGGRWEVRVLDVVVWLGSIRELAVRYDTR